MPDDNTHALDTLSAAYVREHNPQVDEAMATLEDRVDTLEDEKADLEDTVEAKDDRIDELADERDTAQKLLDTFRESKRKEHLARIREANESLPADDQVDLASLEESDPDQLATVADFAEKLAAQTTQVASGDAPDLSSVEGDGDLDEQLREAAADIGMADAFEQATSGGFERAPGIHSQANGQAQTQSQASQELDALLDRVAEGGER